MQFTLRPVSDADEEFLYRLYEATHGQQFALLPLPAGQLDALLRMQFSAQRAGYRQQYPSSQDFIIQVNGEPCGRVWLDLTQTQHLHLLDIAILPAHQGTGLGSAVLRQSMEQARQARKPMHLYAARMNAGAIELYRRLGFEVTGQDEIYLEMMWHP